MPLAVRIASCGVWSQPARIRPRPRIKRGDTHVNDFDPPSAGGAMRFGASLVGAAALVGCGGGSTGSSTESVASAVDSTETVTGATVGGTTSTTAVRLASATANTTPILTCDTPASAA
jgi:hypothetical protein